MRLSDKERKIIFCAQLRADCSISEIAKLCGYRDHTVRYVIKTFEERGLIQKYPYINVHALGFENYIFNFSLDTDKKGSEEFISRIIASERVAWLSRRTGTYQWAASVFVKNSVEFSVFEEELTQTVDIPLRNKAIVIHTSCYDFQRLYLLKSGQNDLIFRYGQLDKPVKIDEVDHEILSTLSGKGLTSESELSRAVGMPVSTLSNRLKKLRERQIISGYAYAFFPQELGFLVYRLHLTLKGTSISLKKAIYEFCKDHVSIVSMMNCVGPWDFEIKVECQTQFEVDSVVQSLYSSFGKYVQEIELVSLDKTSKLAYYPFVNATTVLS